MVMAMVGSLGRGMEVVDGMHSGRMAGRMSGECRGISRVRGDTLVTPNHTTFQVRSSV